MNILGFFSHQAWGIGLGIASAFGLSAFMSYHIKKALKTINQAEEGILINFTSKLAQSPHISEIVRKVVHWVEIKMTEGLGPDKLNVAARALVSIIPALSIVDAKQLIEIEVRGQNDILKHVQENLGLVSVPPKPTE